MTHRILKPGSITRSILAITGFSLIIGGVIGGVLLGENPLHMMLIIATALTIIDIAVRVYRFLLLTDPSAASFDDTD